MAGSSYHNHTNELTLSGAFASVASGYIAGGCGLIVLHPLDSIKALIQTGEYSKRKSFTSGDFLPRLRSFSSLYSGLSVPLFTVGFIQSLNFCVFDSSRRFLFNIGKTTGATDSYLQDDSAMNVGLAGGIAGSTISILTSPMSILKTKQQVRPTMKLFDTMKETYAYRSSGFRNFYIGYSVHLYCEAVGRTMLMFSYETMKRQFAVLSDVSVTEIHPLERIVSSAFASILAWTIIYPADVVRIKLHSSSVLQPDKSPSLKALVLAKSLWRAEGITPFFRGYSYTIMRAPLSAVLLPVYDMCHKYLLQCDTF
jgi:hypothetical protein